jgi:sec-independent protein translocase protein TatC
VKDIDETKQPLLEHLIELRRRLLWSLATLVLFFFICFHFAENIFAVLVQPLLKAGQGRLIYTDVFEAFFVQVKVALFAAIMLSFPMIATQLWRFVAPGMYAKEKKAFLPFLLATPVFFAAGACFAYFLAVPWALHFLLSYQGNVGGVQQEALPGVGNYLNFITHFLFGFGAAFLLPILLMILERAGIVTRQQLARSRRYAIVAAAAVAGVLTPPDAVSMMMLMVPLYGLYEFAILAIRITHWRAARKAARSGSVVSAVVSGPRTEEGPEAPPGGGRVGGSGPRSGDCESGGAKGHYPNCITSLVQNEFRHRGTIPNIFLIAAVTTVAAFFRSAETQVNQRYSCQAFDRAWNAAVSPIRRRCVRTGPSPISHSHPEQGPCCRA